MADKTDKSKQPAPAKHIPKDAQVIMSIMRDMDINEYEPRVINQLLEFIYRYVACILEDAKTYANHAKKKSIDLDDVKLALNIQLENVFTNPPPREILAEVARVKNNSPLPIIKPHCGVRLPPDRFCLSSSNLKIKVSQYPKKNVKMASAYAGGISERSIKMTSKSTMGVLKRAVSTASRTQTITVSKTVNKLVNQQKANDKLKIQAPQNFITPSTTVEEEIANGLKRKREEDDYDML